jgi:hypothetical protein
VTQAGGLPFADAEQPTTTSAAPVTVAADSRTAIRGLTSTRLATPAVSPLASPAAASRPSAPGTPIPTTSSEIVAVATQADQKLTLIDTENTGNTAHALRIVGEGNDVSTDNFGSGESASVNVVLPPGEYRLICPILGHEQQGMSATFTMVSQ